MPLPGSSCTVLSDVDAFCRELRPHEELCYLEHRQNDQIVALARKHNILGIPVPTRYGGRGADALTYAAALVRLGCEGTGVRTFFSGHTSIGQYPIIRWGNDEQHARYLPPSVRGECILAFGLTEPDAGSNPLEMTTTYRRSGNRFLLNGVKYLISNGAICQAAVVFAYPADEPEGQRRMSAFIVDATGDTFEHEDLPAKLGMFTANTGMFQMTDHPVPVENLLGAEGDGFRIAMGTLVSGRLSVAAGCVGVIEDCLAEVLSYSRERSQHGKLIGKHQLVQEHVAMIEQHRAASAAMVERAAAAKKASDSDTANPRLAAEADLRVAQAKLFASNAAWDAADRAVQVYGGRGYSELYRVGRHLQDVRVCRIYEGTDEILKLKIAAALLGKEFAAFH
ncbi:MAG TPA: acyl-CoA dehydrogenase family protein [Pirellulales bacterium]|jgi:alkylation response protein AidB-like acyl-CoA dehydrogenase|nr:acyl-CoA dehydrogenase family protein [Pirellulales bacterium]